jgi:CubicO group peptidase (beta-lactamase class C family)
MNEVIDSLGPDHLDEPVETLMRCYEIIGLSLAIARDDHLVLAKGYGMADPRTGEKVTPNHRFRIASISKPVTAVTIMYLIEQQPTELDDLLERGVFGPDGVLGETYGTPPYPDRVHRMTVRHLLQNTSGWTNDGGDPMFFEPTMTRTDLIDWMLDQREPANDPGTSYHYLNFGFCLLGRVIEQLTSVDYETCAKRALAECGSHGMEIGGATLAERKPAEVVYTEDAYEMLPARMDSHGGWIARPIDLLRLAVRSDGRTESSILQAESTAEMLCGSAANPEYGLGWVVKEGQYGHDGGLPGTIAYLLRREDGITYALAANSHPEDESFGDEMKALLDDLAAITCEWQGLSL